MTDRQAVTGEQWAKLDPPAQAVTPILTCRSCGATKPAPTGTPSDLFPAEHCGECPPWTCPDCDEMDSAANPCGCWTDLTSMPLADQKAIFARDGLFNLGADGRLST